MRPYSSERLLKRSADLHKLKTTLERDIRAQATKYGRTKVPIETIFGRTHKIFVFPKYKQDKYYIIIIFVI